MIREQFERLLDKYGVTEKKVISKSRKQSIVNIRKNISKDLRDCGFSFPQIGAIMNRDHTTIIHYIYGKKPYKKGLKNGT